MNAAWPVDANHPAAPEAFPTFLFLFDKFFDAGLVDGFEILDHTHSVLSPVAFIQLPQTGARKFGAFGAEPAPNRHEFGARFDPAQDARFILAGIIGQAAGATVFLPQESDAEAAIHAAWRNQVRDERSAG